MLIGILIFYPTFFTIHMTQTFTATLFVSFLLLAAANSPVQAQTKSATPLRYKDTVEANATADADIKVVSEYVNTLIGGYADKAKVLLASNYKGYGPSAADSATTEKVVSNWKQSYKAQSNRTFNFVQATFTVKSGSLKGNWVSLWGNYGFTQNGKKLTLPVQYTAHVTNGKIDVDRIYYDNLAITQALGYKLTPSAASAAAK
jgi:hypothetical protein